jgi:hypothetical protein
MKTNSPYLGRYVAVITAVVTLALAVLPVAANFDWRSTAGIIAGLVAVQPVVLKWLSGLQAHEQRLATPLIYPGIAASTSGTGISSQVTVTTSSKDPAGTDPEPPIADPAVKKDSLDSPEAKP